MGILKYVLRAALAVGAAYAGVKITEKYKNNNPDGVTGAKETLDAVGQAASEVAKDAVETVKTTVTEKGPQVLSAVEGAAVDAAQFVVNTAQGVVDMVADKIYGYEVEDLSEDELAEYEAAAEEAPAETAAEEVPAETAAEEAPAEETAEEEIPAEDVPVEEILSEKQTKE